MIIKMNDNYASIKLTIQKLPEGLYLATSEDLPGLVVQETTVENAVKTAKVVAQLLIEARRERDAG
jgi:predicted RNase H-like HicB family nuclease